MKEQFVTYELAEKLKDIGFDEPCLAYWTNDEFKDLCSSAENVLDGDFVVEVPTDRMKAPLWQQVFDWFREKKNIVISYNYRMTDGYKLLETPEHRFLMFALIGEKTTWIKQVHVIEDDKLIAYTEIVETAIDYYKNPEKYPIEDLEFS